MMNISIEIDSITLMWIFNFEIAESVEVYDDDELDREEWNNEIDEARFLNDLKKGEELPANMTINSRQVWEQSIFLKDNNPKGTTNEQGHAQESEDMNHNSRILAHELSRYKMLLAFVIQSRVGNIFSDDDELTPTYYENIDNSIDFKKDTFLM